jgi:hypothetical protein
MPTFRHGKSTVVLLNGYDMSAYLNEATQTFSLETGETTTFGSSDKTYVAGLGDGTISCSGLFDGAANASDPVIRGELGEEDNTFTVLPEGATAGRTSILANGQITSYEVSSPVSDVVSISAEIQADGGLWFGSALNDLSVVSASAVTTGADNSASTSNGAVANLHVTSNNRDGATTVKVQHSADDITYVDLITFTNVSASAVAGETVTSTGTVNRYLRAQIVPAGTSGSVTYHVSVARR